MEPAEALSRKKIRGGHRGTVTRALGEIATALTSDVPDRDKLARPPEADPDREVGNFE